MMSDHPDFYIFGIIDGLGDVHRAVCLETGDTIYLEGYMPDKLPEGHPKPEWAGEMFYYESDAYHLKQWAADNGMESFKHGYKYDDLGEPWKVYED